MNIIKMQWSGVVIKSGSTVIMVDPIHDGYNHHLFGEALTPFFPLVDYSEQVDAIVLTHLHSDHFDFKAILKSYGENVPIFAYKELESTLHKLGFNHIISMDMEEQEACGEFTLVPVFASDGLGDPQASWIIKDQSHTLFHGGDTLWHGRFGNYGQKYGPFDAVILPINAPVIQDKSSESTPIPITMSPEQAVEAAKLLKATRLIPHHYGSFHHPPYYQETTQPLKRLQKAMTETSIKLEVLNEKEILCL